MRITLIFIFSLLTLISCNNDEDENVENNNEIILFSEQARVVGYLPTWRFALTDKIDFCKLTHINIAFGNPMVDGTIQLSNQSAISSLEQLINTAKSQNSSIKFYISLAGGVLSTQVADTWKNFLMWQMKHIDNESYEHTSEKGEPKPTMYRSPFPPYGKRFCEGIRLYRFLGSFIAWST